MTRVVSLASPAAERGSWTATLVPAVVGAATGAVLIVVAVVHGVAPIHGIMTVVATAIVMPWIRILTRRRDRPRIDPDADELVIGTHRIPAASLVSASVVHGTRDVSLDLTEHEVGEHRIAITGEHWALSARQRDVLIRVLERSSIRVPAASCTRAGSAVADGDDSTQPLSRDEALALVRQVRPLAEGTEDPLSSS